MLRFKEKRDKKSTLIFKTQNGIKRSKPQNVSNERTDPDPIEDPITEHSENGAPNTGGENVNG